MMMKVIWLWLRRVVVVEIWVYRGGVGVNAIGHGSGGGGASSGRSENGIISGSDTPDRIRRSATFMECM